MDHHPRRAAHPRALPGGIAIALLLAGLLLVAGAAVACSTGATAGDVSPVGSLATSAAAGDDVQAGGKSGIAGADWTHVLQVVANLQADPPTKPLIVLLGGSSARESTVSDASWSAQVDSRGGPSVVTYNLGSRNRTLAQNVALVKALPERSAGDAPTIVYIGINVGAFTSAQKSFSITLPSPTPLPDYHQHQYDDRTPLSAGNKRMLVAKWLQMRYPVFKRNYDTSVSVLTTLITTCQSRGLHPVLFELPRNTEIIGHMLDAPVTRYRATCRSLASKYGIPYVSLITGAGLRNRDFYDLWHILDTGQYTGRRKWQRLLSDRTVTLLEEYATSDAAGSD